MTETLLQSFESHLLSYPEEVQQYYAGMFRMYKARLQPTTYIACMRILFKAIRLWEKEQEYQQSPADEEFSAQLNHQFFGSIHY